MRFSGKSVHLSANMLYARGFAVARCIAQDTMQEDVTKSRRVAEVENMVRGETNAVSPRCLKDFT